MAPNVYEPLLLAPQLTVTIISAYINLSKCFCYYYNRTVVVLSYSARFHSDPIYIMTTDYILLKWVRNSIYEHMSPHHAV